MEHRRVFIPWASTILFMGLFAILACDRKNSPPSASAYSEIDTQPIATQTGVPFSILKTVSQGGDIRQKFLWVSFDGNPGKDRVEAVIKNILDALIAKYPRTFHAFTFHLFYKDKLRTIPEDSPTFARATFLPDGDKGKVGRIPIEDYRAYKLSIAYSK
jgi:hypothetical protein